MNRRMFTGYAFLTATMAGCVQPIQPVTGITHVMMSQLTDTERQQYCRPGTGQVAGQAFIPSTVATLPTIPIAGRLAVLTPDLTYFNEVYNHAEELTAADRADARSAASQCSRQAVTDGNGNFVFGGVPAGKWLVRVDVYTQFPTGQYTYSEYHRTWTADAQVFEGQVTRVMMVPP
jgi:hypothetical protein